MKTTDIDLPENLGGHLVKVEIEPQWMAEDYGNEPTHHVWEWVLQSVEIEGMSRYPETNEEGKEMLPFTPNAEQLAYIQKAVFEQVKQFGIE